MRARSGARDHPARARTGANPNANLSTFRSSSRARGAEAGRRAHTA
jgi:hypothetical protein